LEVLVARLVLVRAALYLEGLHPPGDHTLHRLAHHARTLRVRKGMDVIVQFINYLLSRGAKYATHYEHWRRGWR
jgi:hypothetical protein